MLTYAKRIASGEVADPSFLVEWWAAADSHYTVAALQARAGTIERAMQESLDRREKFRREDEAREAAKV